MWIFFKVYLRNDNKQIKIKQNIVIIYFASKNNIKIVILKKKHLVFDAKIFLHTCTVVISVIYSLQTWTEGKLRSHFPCSKGNDLTQGLWYKPIVFIHKHKWFNFQNRLVIIGAVTWPRPGKSSKVIQRWYIPSR